MLCGWRNAARRSGAFREAAANVLEEAIELDHAIAALQERMTHWKGSLTHALPDSVLYNLAIDVREHGAAVKILAVSEVPRASYANARSALEAAIDMRYLVAVPGEYDRRGCLARSVELLGAEDFAKRRRALDERLGVSDSPSYRHADDVMSAEADNWESAAPSKGAILRTAFDEVMRRGNLRGHWSGLSRLDLLDSCGTLDPEGTSDADILGIIHSFLSLQTHPSPRAGQRAATVTPETATVVFTNRPEDRTHPSRAAAHACVLAALSLDARHE